MPPKSYYRTPRAGRPAEARASAPEEAGPSVMDGQESLQTRSWRGAATCSQSGRSSAVTGQNLRRTWSCRSKRSAELPKYPGTKASPQRPHSCTVEHPSPPRGPLFPAQKPSRPGSALPPSAPRATGWPASPGGPRALAMGPGRTSRHSPGERSADLRSHGVTAMAEAPTALRASEARQGRRSRLCPHSEGRAGPAATPRTICPRRTC